MRSRQLSILALVRRCPRTSFMQMQDARFLATPVVSVAFLLHAPFQFFHHLPCSVGRVVHLLRARRAFVRRLCNSCTRAARGRVRIRVEGKNRVGCRSTFGVSSLFSRRNSVWEAGRRDATARTALCRGHSIGRRNAASHEDHALLDPSTCAFHVAFVRTSSELVWFRRIRTSTRTFHRAKPNRSSLSFSFSSGSNRRWFGSIFVLKGKARRTNPRRRQVRRWRRMA